MTDSKNAIAGSDASEQAVLFRKPWVEETRKTKRNLLLAGTAGLAASVAGIMPKEISAFGLTVDDIDQTAFLVLLTLVVGYFLIMYAFSVYSDFMSFWWDKTGDMNRPVEEDYEEQAAAKLRIVSTLGVYLDVLIPITVGAAAIVGLLFEVWS